MPFSKMPKSVKKGVGKSKKKQKKWMSVYEKVKKDHGGDKETAAKIAYGAIKEDMKKLTLETFFNEEFPVQTFKSDSQDPKKNPDVIKQQMMSFIQTTDFRDSGAVQTLKDFIERILEEI